MNHAPAPAFHTLYTRSGARFFPFGSGGRGSRQRVYLEFSKWGARMRVTEMSLKVGQIVGAPVTVLKVGFSRLDGKLRLFYFVNFSGTFDSVVRAFKTFRVTRRNNKIHQRKRRG